MRAKAASGRPRLVLAFAEREVALGEGENVIGRDEGLAVSIDSPGVSRRHARITVRCDEASLEDLGSKNGTFVGDRRLDARMPLRDGDFIRLGKVCLVFQRLITGTSTDSVVET